MKLMSWWCGRLQMARSRTCFQVCTVRGCGGLRLWLCLAVIDGIDKLDTPPLHQLKLTVHITTADLKFSQTYTTSPRQAQKATETLIIKTSSLSTQQQALTTNFPTQPARRRKNSRNAAPAAPKLGPDLTIFCTPPIISTRPT